MEFILLMYKSRIYNKTAKKKEEINRCATLDEKPSHEATNASYHELLNYTNQPKFVPDYFERIFLHSNSEFIAPINHYR